MPAHKIAITIPPAVLARLDQWAARKNQSRSRFITEQLEKRLQELEDEEVTRLYDAAYRDKKLLQDNQRMAKDMSFLALYDDRETWKP